MIQAWYDSMLDRIPVPYESRQVDTRYGKTHVMTAGMENTPPLLMIHGLGGCSVLWKWQFEALSTHFRLFVVDTIGQPGKSAPARPSHRGSPYADWLVDVLDGLQLEKSHIMGISLGGRIVMKLGAYAPERVIKAVLLSPMGLVKMRLSLIFRLLPLGFNLRGPSDETLRTLMRSVMSVPDKPIRPDVKDALEGLFLFSKYYKQEGLSGLPMALPLSEKELDACRVPVLMLVGQHEQLFNPHQAISKARQALSGLEAAELVPGVGHTMNFDDPDAVNTRVLAFLQTS